MPDFRLSPKAEQDLESVWVYSFEQWGKARAESYVDSLISAFCGLASSSELAVSCEHIRVGYRFCRQGKYIIYFKETVYGVEIVRILYECMQPSLHI